MSKINIYDKNDLKKKLRSFGFDETEIENILAEENTWFTEEEFYETCEYYKYTYVRTEAEAE